MKYVKEFEGLRGLMALWVVIGHWATSVPLSFDPLPPKLYNAYAVDVFIMLSGFAIFSLMEKSHEGYLPYITRRFFRIFPVYLFFLAISIAMQPFVADVIANGPPAHMQDRRVEIVLNTADNWWAHVLAHIGLLQGIIPDRILPDTSFAFLGQAWSLSLEWQFYLTAPLLLLLVKEWRRPMALATIVALALFAFFSARFFESGYLGSKIHLFAVGIATFYAMRAILAPQSRFSMAGMDPAILRAILVGAVCFLILLRSHVVLPYLIWVVMLYIALGASQTEDSLAKLGSRIMNSAPLQWLGHISYSVYLSHMIVITVGLYALEQVPGLSRHEFAFALLAIVVPGTILFSWLTYRTIEKPFMDMAKGWADEMSRRRSGIARSAAPIRVPELAAAPAVVVQPTTLVPGPQIVGERGEQGRGVENGGAFSTHFKPLGD